MTFLLFSTPSLDPHTDFDDKLAPQGKDTETGNTHSWGQPVDFHLVLLGRWSRLIFTAGLVNLLPQSRGEERMTTSQHKNIYSNLPNRIKSIRQWIFCCNIAVIRRTSLPGLFPGRLEHISLFSEFDRFSSFPPKTTLNDSLLSFWLQICYIMFPFSYH